ncbi:DUF3108 domain-containing protein [Chitinophaga sp. 22321]|uniref:Uncharacterized protein n=1 Tax=Chitinophaga hostae TaxID=2831022 RepID=A0ABS5J6G0_9BACT|nr:hypothetical protein [Chitinophaga hostae]MBS0030791.1 hypothetical protein [Chitinophaga hostae]
MRLRLTIFNIKQVFLPVTGLLILLATATYAQVDTIDQRHQRLNTAFLKPGVRQYLVYFQLPTRSNMLSLSLWVREIEKTNRNNVPVFKTTQHWYSEDTARYAMFTSFNTVSDFSPLFHEEIRGKDRKAYNWSAQGVAGDSGPDNKAADFKFDFDRPNYNWHLDIETFEMLPLAKGKIFEINFYDAGLDTPKYVRYQVTGSDVLQTLNNQAVDCWKLFTEGESPRGHYTQIFWISKAGHELLKEEDSFGGMFRYKIKLPGLTPYLDERFVKQAK